MGWKISGHMDAKIKKSILMILPHTSWHDFYIGLFARGIIGLEMHYVAKKELFRFPFGWYFRWMGGEPLDRAGNLNKVDAIAEVFKKRDIFRMAIAPEGTRKKVSELKSGFYFIAMKTNVPIIPVGFNYQKKEVSLGKPFYPIGNIDADLKVLARHFVGVKGKIPENGFDTKICL
jgi:1-acyl-sn-glycerol-3-phosphate acyltransferase